MLYYYESKSYEEICKEIHQAMGTVKSRLYRARHLLRARLEDPIAIANK